MDTALAYQAFRDAVTAAKSQGAFARGVGTSQQRISYLLKHHRLLPGELVLRAEDLTGVSRHRLRPDLYPQDDAASVPLAHGSVVAPDAPIVACDQSAASHSGAEA
jgi:DNA-binding transcriptional regulator YdaS (Cro superfamily)